MMLADVNSASLPGIAASPGLKASNSFNRQTSSSDKPVGKTTTTTTAADGNNNDRNKNASPESPDSPAAEAPLSGNDSDDNKMNQRRASSFKRAMRLQPLYSQDLADLDSIPMADDDSYSTNSRTTGGDVQRASRSEQRQPTKNGHHSQTQMSKSRGGYGSSGSNSMESSDDSDRDDRHKQKQVAKQRDKKTKQQQHLQPPKMTSMYSSMPSLHTLERKPAQKRRPGQTKSGAKTSRDVAKSSENVSSNVADDDRTEAAGSDVEALYRGSGRQYRRRWEGTDDGMQKKVPALHDTYGRRSRENLLRKKGGSKGSATGARLTDWGSVDKLTHGSLSDLSHLKDDPWIMKTNSSPNSSPRSRDSPPTICLTSPYNMPSRSISVSQMQSSSRDWNLGPVAATRPRNYSDVSDDAARRSGKENLDWVYLNRNPDDNETRERASSFNQAVGIRSRGSSDDLLSKALRDSNCSNVSKSSSLCQDTLKRYSLESSDDGKKKASDKEDSSVVLAASPKLAVSSEAEGRCVTKATLNDHNETHSNLCTSFVSPGCDEDVEMTDETSRRGSNLISHPVALPRSPKSPSKDVIRNTETLSTSDQTPRSYSSNNTQQHLSATLITTDSNTQVSGPAAVHSTSPLNSPTLHHLPSPESADQSFSKPQQSGHYTHTPTPQPRRLYRPLSPESALSAESERMVAEMERYYQANTPRTPASVFKFPSSPSSENVSSQAACASSMIPTSQDAQGFHQAGEERASVSSASKHHLQVDHNGPPNNRDSINRLSGVSSSSSNDGGFTAGQHHNLFPPGDVNTNRLSGVSSISTSSYESQNSNSSDSLVGTLKTKLSVLTNKLGGGKRSREEDLAHSHHHDESDFQNRSSELQEVLRGHALGSSNLGSRMAHTLPVGMEPLLSPSDSPKEQALSSYEYSSKESTPEPQSRFSFPSAVTTKNQKSTGPETLPPCSPVQQSDSGICMYDVEPTESRRRGLHERAKTLPANISAEQFLAEGEAMDGDGYADDRIGQRRCSASSTASVDSFYERRLSVAFESSAFHDHRIFIEQQQQQLQGGEGQPPPSGEGSKHNTQRRSIREVVQYIEEKFRPRQPKPVEVKRKEPSALIRQRLQSLRDNASYKRRFSNRSVSEDRTRTRDRTPDSPRISRPEQRNRSGSSNQFVHRVQTDSCTAETRDLEHRAAERGRERQTASRREMEMLAMREREMAAKRERDLASKRDREMAAKQEIAATREKAATREMKAAGAGEVDIAASGGATELERAKSEARSDDGGSSNLSGMGSMDRLDQLSTDVDNLVIMRGWVRSLINKFQQKT